MQSTIRDRVSEWASVADEYEALLIEEKTSEFEIGPSGIESSVEVSTFSLLLTLIQNHRLARLSFAVNELDQLGRIEAIPTVALALSEGEPKSYGLQIGVNGGGRELPSGTLGEGVHLSNPEIVGPALVEKCTRMNPAVRSSIVMDMHKQIRTLWNSHGLNGRYEKMWGTIRLQANLPNRQAPVGLWFPCPLEEDRVLKGLEAVLTDSAHALPFAEIKGGSSPVLLSPPVVALLCRNLARRCTVDPQNSMRLEGLPEAFELSENPMQHGSKYAALFDDEGVPTRAKVLIRGPERKAVLTNLRTAAMLGIPPSGNGFRRGRFAEPSSDVSPGIFHTHLVLKAGQVTRDEVIRSNKEIVVLDRVVMPFQEANDVTGAGTLRGYLGRVARNGQVVARLAHQVAPRKELVSSRAGRSHGTLLDRRAVILSDGARLESGWYPFIFLPCVHW